jgi:hypothetical protein
MLLLAMTSPSFSPLGVAGSSSLIISHLNPSPQAPAVVLNGVGTCHAGIFLCSRPYLSVLGSTGLYEGKLVTWLGTVSGTLSPLHPLTRGLS